MSRSFDIIAGGPGSSVIIHVPHASRAIPDDVRNGILLDDEALMAELDAMTDAFTDVIAQHAADQAPRRPWLFINRLSRLVVDPERFPDEREELNAVGMGAVYERTSTGAMLRAPSVEERDGVIDGYFTPYAAAFERLVEERIDAVGEATIIDLHSFPREALPYELHADGPRPEVCLGTAGFHTGPELLLAARRAFERHTPLSDVGVDAPFSGCYVPLKHYDVSPDVHAIMIELRRDLYVDDTFAFQEGSVAPLVAGVGEVIEAADRQLDQFTPREDLESLCAAFEVNSLDELGEAIHTAAGFEAETSVSVDVADGETLMWVDDTYTVLTFPACMFEVADLADHIRMVASGEIESRQL
ncbi:MAG TPA: N-formylglutamate amidohydrolase [Aeromicrobium sp.]|nr:N-formylglutamate amidohydrolase [Aeromicrobium sp.]